MSTTAVPNLELEGLRVTLDRLVYHRRKPDQPPGKPHLFTYFLSIHNESSLVVTIRSRKWVVTQDDGVVLVFEGDGVVGQTPEISQGQRFSYHSRHEIDSQSAEAQGAYFGLDDFQRRVFVRIPKFRLVVPSTLDERG